MNTAMREQLTTLLIMLGLSAGFLFGVALPRSRTLGSIVLETENLQQENEAALAQLEDVEQLHNRVERLRAELLAVQRRIPLEDHFAEYENLILQLGERHGLWTPATEPRIVDNTPVARATTGLQSRGMKLAFTARFEDFYSFLKELESQEKLTAIESIEIEPDPKNLLSDQFQVDLELRIFHGQL